METVSSSDLVRHFGTWQDRALQGPVYVQQHGRVRLVLSSIEFMEELSSARANGGSNASSIESLLDLIDSMVVVTDDRLCVIGMSHPARHHFAKSEWRGQTLHDLLPEQLRGIFMRSVQHVLAGGVADTFQLRLGDKAERTIDVSIRPLDGGVCIIGHDRRATQVRIETGAIYDSVRQTLNLLGTVAVVRLNLRGFITGASESFEAMSGLTAEAYRSVRMPTLFDIGSRMAVSDALERAIDRIEPQVVAAKLVVNRGEPQDVRVAFSAETLRASLDFATATIVCSTGSQPGG